MTEVRVIVFPHAGGLAISYIPLAKQFANRKDVKLYEYSGHGARMSEPLFSNWEDTVEEAVNRISKERSDPLCIIGHSAGSIIAYETARTLEQMGQPAEWVVLSGQTAPDYPREIPDDSHIREYLLSMGGTTEELLDSDEYRRYLYPMIQSDFAILRKYQCLVPYRLKHTKGMVLWGRTDSSLTEEGVEQWKRFFSTEPLFHSYEGGHFYLFDHWQDIFQEIQTFTGENYG